MAQLDDNVVIVGGEVNRGRVKLVLRATTHVYLGCTWLKRNDDVTYSMSHQNSFTKQLLSDAGRGKVPHLVALSLPSTVLAKTLSNSVLNFHRKVQLVFFNWEIIVKMLLGPKLRPIVMGTVRSTCLWTASLSPSLQSPISGATLKQLSATKAKPYL